MLYMPDNSASQCLYADQLLSAFKAMKQQGKYGRMLVMMEACESGSLFEGSDLAGLNILAVTAAAAEENSYPEYCCSYFKPPSCTVAGQDVGTCLGDLFSVGWLEAADQSPAATVSELIDAATQRAAGMSHVQVYGQESLKHAKASDFLGAASASDGPSSPQRAVSSMLPAPLRAFDAEEQWQAIQRLLPVNTTLTGLPRSGAEFRCYREGNRLVDELCGGYQAPFGAKFARVMAGACASGQARLVEGAVRRVCGVLV